MAKQQWESPRHRTTRLELVLLSELPAGGGRLQSVCHVIHPKWAQVATDNAPKGNWGAGESSETFMPIIMDFLFRGVW